MADDLNMPRTLRRLNAVEEAALDAQSQAAAAAASAAAAQAAAEAAGDNLDMSNATAGILSQARGGLGNANGQAVSAGKLTSAFTLALTGGVTGSVSIDGSRNVSLAATVAGSGAVTGRKDDLLTTAVAANVDYTVPSYIVGSNKLKIELDGVLCAAGAGNTYIERGTTGNASTVIRFNQSIPAGFLITSISEA